MTRRLGAVAFTITACVLIAGLVAIAIRASVSEVIVVGLVSGVLGSGVTAIATLLAVRWTMEGQRDLDRKARAFERHALAVDRRRAAFRQLLVASDHLMDAARQVRLYPQGRPPADPDQKDYDRYAAVNESAAAAAAAFRAAEPDLTLDLGPKADPVLHAYDELRLAVITFRIVMQAHPAYQLGLEEKENEAYVRVLGAWQKLRAETHLELPKPGTEDWPELPPL
jgi:hypothetical protein